MDKNDIVRILDTVESRAGRFCHERRITGKIIGRENGRTIIDCGLGYNIFVSISDIQVVAKATEIPMLDDGGP